MSELEEFAAAAATAAGAAAATAAEWRQQAEHPGGMWVFALLASGGVGLLALAVAAASGTRAVRAVLAPRPAAGRPAPGAGGRAPVPPEPRHASDVDDRADDSAGFSRHRVYAAYEMRRWSL